MTAAKYERIAPGVHMVHNDTLSIEQAPTEPQAPKSRFGYLRGNGSEVPPTERTLTKELARVYTEEAPRDPMREQLEILLARRKKHER